MVKANELRVDNLVFRKFWNPQPGNERYSLDRCAIEIIKRDTVNLRLSDNSILAKYPIIDLTPIPLTPEILAQYGFFIKNGLPTLETNLLFNISYDGDSFNLFDPSFESSHGILAPKVKYIHQLQNLYFALTNEELIFQSIKELITK